MESLLTIEELAQEWRYSKRSIYRLIAQASSARSSWAKALDEPPGVRRSATSPR